MFSQLRKKQAQKIGWICAGFVVLAAVVLFISVFSILAEQNEYQKLGCHEKKALLTAESKEWKKAMYESVCLNFMPDR